MIGNILHKKQVMKKSKMEVVDENIVLNEIVVQIKIILKHQTQMNGGKRENIRRIR